MCPMKWFHDWLLSNQFTMIFNGDMDCGLYNTNCYGNGLDGVFIFSPDVDSTLAACASTPKISAKRGDFTLPSSLTGSGSGLDDSFKVGDEERADKVSTRHLGGWQIAQTTFPKPAHG